MRTIKIFDTTLRDGEQSPGCSMSIEEKLRVARQLVKLKADIIEAGFPAASEGDFQAVRRIAEEIQGPTIAALCRATEKDIELAAEALWPAIERNAGRIHTFLATSDIHLRHKLKKTRAEVLDMAAAAVRRARKFTGDVEFSAEDATRSDPEFLARVVETVIRAGATTVNIPDTVGYAITTEYGELIKHLFARVPNIGEATISVHCHDDLGLAVSNSLAGVLSGAGQVECTINGIGERAGNAALEEVVMAIRTRGPYFEARTDIATQEIMAASKLVRGITGMHVQANKAVVGHNAFAHESGIHQDGFLKEKSTYEIMTPESVGAGATKLVLGKHSGRHGIQVRLKELGYDLKDEQLDKVFAAFKELADKKEEVFDEDLEAIVAETIYRIPAVYKLLHLHTSGGTDSPHSAYLELAVGRERLRTQDTGDGPVDAAYKAIKSLTGSGAQLINYEVKAITPGTDAQGEVVAVLRENKLQVSGHSYHTNIIEGSVLAYVDALNKLESIKKGRQNGKQIS